MKKLYYFLQLSLLISLGLFVFSTVLTAGVSKHHFNEAKSVENQACLLSKTRQVPPTFIDPIPNDTTVVCIDSIPAAIDLMAMDDMGNTFSVSPLDSPDASMIDACTGGMITRTWSAIASGDTTIATQIITILADNTPPMPNIAETFDTVSCELSKLTAPSQALRYDVWINSIRIALATSASDDCSGIANITDDAPFPYDESCATLAVTFTITDNCGASNNWIATYTTIDTVPPVLIDIPNDTILSCAEMIPIVASVTASDDCTNGIVDVVFSENNTQLMNGTCNQYEYFISRTWVATDFCGNETEASQLITVRDDLAPTFTVPADITLNCTDDPLDLNVAGDVTDAADNCTPTEEIEITHTDEITPGACEFNYIIKRTWRARDICGNVTGKNQFITLVDNEAPTFDVPADITVDCSIASDMGITGIATNLADNCDMNLTANFSDIVIAGACVNSYTIRRTWSVEDVCGNFTELEQQITVTDNAAPVYSIQPQNITLFCDAGQEVDIVFNNWIVSNAGASAVDNCTMTGDLNWSLFNSGTITPAFLPAAVCPATSDTIRSQAVDVIVEDECGNQNFVTVTFSLIDNTSPIIRDCPAGMTVPTDPGLCSALFELPPPVIEDECSYSSQTENLSETAPITTSAAPGDEGITPVDPIEFNLNLTVPAPVNAQGDAMLTITLTSVDGEEATEYFNVLGEDGSLIGITNSTIVQCGNSTTALTIPVMQLNEWAADGTITIRLEPNIPANLDGKFAINKICNPAGTVALDLSFTVKELRGLVFEYKIDGNAKVTAILPGPFSEVLDQGNHLITYYATDCAGNIDSCSYSVTVEDREAPVLNCPADIVREVTADSCSATVVLPLPVGALDNCDAYGLYSTSLPADTTGALLVFSYDPNLNDYVADTKIFTFTGVSANAFNPVNLIIDFKGDFNTNGAFMSILGDDDSVLAVSAIGAADCTTPGQINISIPAATFNSWANDGIVEIKAVPNPINVPPGVAGDGINPCDPSAVNNTGDTDGISYVFAAMDYDRLSLSYYTEGKTIVPLTPMAEPDIRPSVEFGIGQTEVFYIMSDVAGNIDTCSFMVTVEDNIAPVASCVLATTLFIEPSGLQVEIIDAVELDLGSTDNCGIEQRLLNPNIFTCADVGNLFNVAFTVVDSSGNASTCFSTISIAPQGPEPTANSGLCGGDTLFLFANPPVENGGVLYTYQWFDPDGALISIIKNPILPNIDANDEGPYRIVITGLTGCQAEGVIFVSIEDLPLTPSVEARSTICTDEDLVLSTPDFPAGNNITFYWYEGLPPNGTLLGTSMEPTFTIPAPHAAGTRSYYIEVEATGCISAPSPAINVLAAIKPVAQVSYPDSTICAGETINIGTFVTGANISYHWTGPNTYESEMQFPEIGPLESVDDGFYYLVVDQNDGCLSLPDSVRITVLDKPATPTISYNGPICAGEDLILTTTSTGASSYHWINASGEEFTTAIPTYTIPAATLLEGGNWKVFVIKNTCNSDNSTTVNVIINAVPVATAIVEPELPCDGDSFQLIGNPDLLGASYQWTGPGISPQFVQSPVISNASELNEGTYILAVISQEGCVDMATVFVTIPEKINILGVSSDAQACLNGPTDIHLDVAVLPFDDGTYTYSWQGPGFSLTTASSTATIPNATGVLNRGEYSLTVTSGDGCEVVLANPYFLDIRDIPNIPEAPMPMDGFNEFCEGDAITLTTTNYQGTVVSYFWQIPGIGTITTNDPIAIIPNIGLSQDGAYTVFVVVDGCISETSPPSTMTVHAIPQITAASNTPVCYEDDIQFFTTFFPNATYEWQGPDLFNAGIQNPTHGSEHQTDSLGIYWVIATVEGCVSDTAFTTVAVNPIPLTPMPLAIVTDSICASLGTASLSLSIEGVTATDQALYTWYNDASGQDAISSASTLPQIIINDFTNYNNDGLYDFYVQADLGGCRSAVSEAIPILINYIPDVSAFAGTDATVCDDETAMLLAEMPSTGTGLWTIIGGNGGAVVIANPSLPETAINGLNIDNSPITFRWTLSNGACVDFANDDVMITVSQAEEADAGDNIIACQGEVINLSSVPPVGMNSIGEWSQHEVQEAFGVSIDDTTNPSSIIDGLIPNNFYYFTWEIASDCGTVSDEVVVFISDPFPDAGTDNIACNEEAMGILQATPLTLGSIGQWSSPNPALIIEDNIADTTVVSNLLPGENLFIWSVDDDMCGERSRDTVIIFYKEPPTAIDDIIGVTFGEPVTFDALVNDIIAPNSMAVVLSNPQLGGVKEENGMFIYTPPDNFVGVDQFEYEILSEGCPSVSAQVTLQIGDGARCKAPSIITPNTDGINDAFVVPCLLNENDFPNSQVIIFNRWGDEVFRSQKPYKNNWTGKYNGEDLPPATYFYIVDFGNGEEPISGYVLIQR